MAQLDALLLDLKESGGSDLHLVVGQPPKIRLHGHLENLGTHETLTEESLGEMLHEICEGNDWKEFKETNDIDFAYGLPGVARFRTNYFRQVHGLGAVFRVIPEEIKTLDDLDMPPALKQLTDLRSGLVLVTGPTGSGKSTTLAAMIDFINTSRACRVLTIEDPIEFVHPNKLSIILQREVGRETNSFANALRSASREDVDVILVGEMRDLETTALAITASETGHLVFATLHTTSAIQTVDRVIDVFPHEAQQQIRMQLSVSLQGVISQTLLPKIGGGRACAQEIMIATAGVRSCIREGKTPQLVNSLQTGAQYGMITLEKALVQLVKDGVVTPDDAVTKANHPASVADELSRGGMAPKNFQPEPAARKQAGTDSRQAQRAVTRRDTPKPVKAAAGGGGIEDDFEQFRARRGKA